MKVLVVGASGATGRLLVEQLLNRGVKVAVIVRSPKAFSDKIRHHEHLSLIQAGVLELTDLEMAQHVKGCDAIASCLGHNMTFKGMFGQPRLLVTDAVCRLCSAIQTNHSGGTVKFILMNTAGNRNRDIPEALSIWQKLVIALLRLLLPPVADNEKAADFLRTEIGQNHKTIEWAIVRPDSLTTQTMVSEYKVYPSPIRDAIFNAGMTSRINVGHFMTELITDDGLWCQWRGQMPVVYNKASTENIS